MLDVSLIEFINTYLPTYGAEPFLRTCLLCSYSRASQHFMEPKGSSLCSQEPSTGSYPIEFISMLIRTIVHSMLHFSMRLESASGECLPRSFEITKLPMIKEDVIICLSVERWAINLILRRFHHMVDFLYSDHSGDSWSTTWQVSMYWALISSNHPWVGSNWIHLVHRKPRRSSWIRLSTAHSMMLLIIHQSRQIYYECICLLNTNKQLVTDYSYLIHIWLFFLWILGYSSSLIHKWNT
jgi:hypothetical protein